MINLDYLLNVLAVFIGYAIFTYYTNSTMQYRKSGLFSNILILCGYILYGFICLQAIPILNVVSFVVINFILLIAGFDNGLWSALYNLLMLTLSMMAGELLISVIFHMQMGSYVNSGVAVAEYVMITMASKMLYFLFVIILKRISFTKKGVRLPGELLLIILLPACSCVFMNIFDRIRPIISHQDEVDLVIFGILLLIVNFTVYVVYDRLIDKNTEIQYLQELKHKNDMDYKSYQLIREKYDELKIMVHDFNKYCNNIEGLLTEKGDKEVISEIQRLKNKNKEFLLVEYTNNRALNVLLSQKMNECSDLGIDFQINIQRADISFISEADVVAIFANLIDNAIEGSTKSNIKKIYLSIYVMNDAYLVIKVNNSSDVEPKVANGRLLTKKNDGRHHGIGMMSIEHSLKNYGGSMRWEYDKDKNTFSSIIMMNFPQEAI